MKKNKGFTLIELLVVIAIVLVLAGMSPVIFSRLLLQNSVSNVADYLKINLRNAQTYSMSGKLGTRWGVALDNGKLVVFSGNSYATRDTGLDQSMNIDTNIVISGLTEVVFNEQTGTPSSSLNISLVAGENNRSIILNAEGGIE